MKHQASNVLGFLRSASFLLKGFARVSLTFLLVSIVTVFMPVNLVLSKSRVITAKWVHKLTLVSCEAKGKVIDWSKIID